MKKTILIFSALFSMFFINAQHQTIGLNYSIGFNPSGDKFTYDNKEIGNYSLGWYQVPGSAEARLSGYGGINFFTQTGSRLIITKNGNVGIGTTTPNQALVVNGSIALNYNQTGGFNGIKRNGVATEYFNLITNSNTSVIHQFTGSNKTIMSMTQGGNVGIGTTTPNQALVVNGSIALNYNETGGFNGIKRNGVATEYFI